MKDLKELLKPTFGKFSLAATFLLWHYYYSYVGIRFYYLDTINSYLRVGLSAIHWNNYFIRGGSMILIWILVAFFIYLVIWTYESCKIFLYNQNIKKKYINSSSDDYKKLLMSGGVKLKTHFKHYLYFGGGVALILTGFLMMSDIFEKIRFFISDSLTINLIENEVEMGQNNLTIIVASFVSMFVVWYIFSCLPIWAFKKGSLESVSTKIAESHFAVVVDNPDASEEDEEEN